jgi:hypothetical protein
MTPRTGMRSIKISKAKASNLRSDVDNHKPSLNQTHYPRSNQESLDYKNKNLYQDEEYYEQQQRKF